MKNSEEIWNKLVEKVSPVTVSEDTIEEITISTKEGGIVAMTTKPNAFTGEFNRDALSGSEDLDDVQFEDLGNSTNESNEEVFIYEDAGIHLKKKILETLSDAVIKTPVLSSYSLNRCTVTKDKIHPVFEFTHRTTEDWIKNRLAQALSEEGRIEAASNLAYGCIDTVYYSQREPFVGWEFDGTLYRYTDEPFEYWSEPDNMSDWVSFCTDSERMEQVIWDRDEHLVHFHPMETRICGDHPYIQWFKDVESQSMTSYKIDSEIVHSVDLVSVSVDESGALLRNTIVL